MALILVVDDNAAGRYGICRCLRDAGHEVTEAGSVAEALPLAVRRRPDLMVLDIRLPDGSGIDLCRTLKDYPGLGDVPVILISALLSDVDYRVSKLGSGADLYLESPLDPRELSAHVARLIEAARQKRNLSESERRFRTMADGLPFLVWVHDAEGRQEFVNRTFCEFFGIAEEQARGEGWQMLMHPEDAPSYMAEFMECVRLRKPFHARVRVRNAQGQWRWIESWGRPRLSETGAFLGFVGASPDITKQKELEDELERLVVERTARLNEMVGELEHMSYSIIHDLRAPLRAIRGFIDILQQPDDPATREMCLSRIGSAARRMDLLITDTLAYSQFVRQEMRLGPVDLDRLVREMLDTYPEFQPQRSRVHVDSPLPRVLANEAGLTQCLSNLIGNAFKFAHPDREPRVRIYCEAAAGTPGSAPVRHLRSAPAVAPPENRAAPDPAAGPGSPCPPDSQLGSWTRICVRDNGVGIPANFASRVFDMFVRGSHCDAGTGIGLALVRKAIDRMGGRVGVESEPGVGSCFWFELPLAPTGDTAGEGQAAELLTGPLERLPAIGAA